LEKFKSFITEEKEQPYKIVLFHNSHNYARDVGNIDAPEYFLMNKSSKAAGIELFHADFQGSRIEEKNGKMFLHTLDFDKDTGLAVKPKEDGEVKFQNPIELEKDNTLILPRGLGTLGFSTNRRWLDNIKILEDKGFKTIPSIETWDLCTSKYYFHKLCEENNLKTPKTFPITYSDDSERVVKDNNIKFPVILKASSGSQTGVGVVIVESLRSLHPTVQMLSLLSKNIDLIIQEYIKIEYDVRVIVLQGTILAAMKRTVITGDARSNASLGADVENIELTELEKQDSIKAAELCKGDLVGVDFMPAKNREKEQPYILEVNSMPGFIGIESSNKDKSITQEILKHFKNRENWR